MTNTWPSDGVAYTLRATSAGFSVFALAIQRPLFEVTDSALSTDTVSAGEQFEGTTTIQNSGAADGTYRARLVASGRTLDETTVSVPAGEDRSVSLTGSLDAAGNYDIAVSGSQLGTLTVEETMTPTHTPEPTPTPTPEPEDTPTPEPEPEEAPTETPAEEETTDDSRATGPGFTIVLTLVALLAAAGIAIRRRR